MKAASAFAGSSSDLAVIELVQGTQDGLRDYATREDDDGGPARTKTYAGETYVRRGAPERCSVDSFMCWHYDVDRGEVSA